MRSETAALVVAEGAGREAALAGGLRVVADLARSASSRRWAATASPRSLPRCRSVVDGLDPAAPDLADLRGQPALRRALEVAAAGGHSLLLVGPPGAGKTMAARRLPSILPPLDPAEAVEVIRIASACGRPLEPLTAGRRPFRAPHHTVSAAGPDRRRHSAAPGRGDARAPRRPLPRRARRVPPRRARGAAPAARGGAGGDRAGALRRSSCRAGSRSSSPRTRARAAAGRPRGSASARRPRSTPTPRS